MIMIDVHLVWVTRVSAAAVRVCVLRVSVCTMYPGLSVSLQYYYIYDLAHVDVLTYCSLYVLRFLDFSKQYLVLLSVVL